MNWRSVSRILVTTAWVGTVVQAATINRHPYVQNVREDRAVILWTTIGDAGRGAVRYGDGAELNRSSPSTVRTFLPEATGLPYAYYQHRAELAPLNAATSYRYEVLVDGQAVGEAAFRTAGPGPFTFLVIGDSGDGGEFQRGIARRMAFESPAFVLHVGDLAYDTGTFAQLDDYYFSVYRPLMRRIPFFPVPGNHDYYSNQAAAYRAAHDVPTDDVPPPGRGLYYSFDWGPVHFVAIDTNRPLDDAVNRDGPMLRWLAQDLRRTRQLWRVAWLHHTPFPTGHQRADEICAQVQRTITPILEREGVHVVLAGHEHAFERTRSRRNGVFNAAGIGTVYVTTGGAGSNMQPVETTDDTPVALSTPHYVRIAVDGPQMEIRGVNGAGDTIDQFRLSAAPYLDPQGVRDAASFSPSLAPGSLITISGLDLATGDELAHGVPLPDRLGGTAASIGGQPMPLLFVSRSQINAQLPFDVEGEVALAVATGGGRAETVCTIGDPAPAVFLVPYGGERVPAAVHLDGRLVTAEAPAAPGEWLALFLTGLGRVRGTVTAGAATPLSPPVSALVPVTVTVGDSDAEVAFAGLAPGMVGLYQVNFRVPSPRTGDLTLRLSAGSRQSVPAILRIR